VLPTILATAPQRLHGMRVTDYRGCSCTGRFVQDGHPLQGLALPRYTLDALLVQQACANGVVLQTGFWVRQPLLAGRRVYGVRGTHAGRPVTVEAPLVIAADGVQSVLGRRLGVIRRVRWLQHIALVTHYTGVKNHQPLGEMFLLPEGYLGLAPVGPELTNVSLVIRAHDVARAHNKPAALLEGSLQAHPELRHRFAQAERVKDVLTTGPMAQRTVCPPYDGILFVGDAAGFFDPFTGQGIYLALHGAELAAATAHQALAMGNTSDQHLQRYFYAHRHAFHDKYRVSALMQLGFRVPWLTNRIIQRLAHNPTLANTMVGVAGDFIPPQAVLSWRFARRLVW
jgi:flavin-dependent dehydrogenase